MAPRRLTDAKGHPPRVLGPRIERPLPSDEVLSSVEPTRGALGGEGERGSPGTGCGGADAPLLDPVTSEADTLGALRGRYAQDTDTWLARRRQQRRERRSPSTTG